MSTTTTGQQAEAVAADSLELKGFRILERNWRTRFCEIDVIAEKEKTVYFVEVKYRFSRRQGGGLEYVTPTKLRQMRYAAESWVSEHDWSGEYQLAAIEISGKEFRVTGFVDSII